MVVVVVVDFVFVFGDVDIVDVVSFVTMMIMRIVVVQACVNFLQW